MKPPRCGDEAALIAALHSVASQHRGPDPLNDRAALDLVGSYDGRVFVDAVLEDGQSVYDAVDVLVVAGMSALVEADQRSWLGTAAVAVIEVLFGIGTGDQPHVHPSRASSLASQYLDVLTGVLDGNPPEWQLQYSRSQR